MAIKKYVTKATVIKAILTENLEHSSWVETTDDWGDLAVADPKCKVCAVGAVLRSFGLDNDAIIHYGNKYLVDNGGPVTVGEDEPIHVPSYVKDHLKNGRYLEALSLKYEDQSRRTGNGKRTRNILKNFVSKNFPNRIKLRTS